MYGALTIYLGNCANVMANPKENETWSLPSSCKEFIIRCTSQITKMVSRKQCHGPGVVVVFKCHKNTKDGEMDSSWEKINTDGGEYTQTDLGRWMEFP